MGAFYAQINTNSVLAQIACAMAGPNTASAESVHVEFGLLFDSEARNLAQADRGHVS